MCALPATRPSKRSTALAASKGLHGTESNASTSHARPGEPQQPSSSYVSPLPGVVTARRYTIDLTDIIEGAPRIRVRTITDRQRNQLAELAVLNERLAGGDAAATRKRIEYLKRKPRTWEAIYQYLTRTEAAATLAAIEEANRKVEEALREGSWESKSVTQMRDELEQLQTQVGEAQERLQATQQRVDSNLQRVQELRQQAVCDEHPTRTYPVLDHHPAQISLEHATTLAEAPAPPTVPRVSDAQTGIDQRRRCEYLTVTTSQHVNTCLTITIITIIVIIILTPCDVQGPPQLPRPRARPAQPLVPCSLHRQAAARHIGARGALWRGVGAFPWARGGPCLCAGRVRASRLPTVAGACGGRPDRVPVPWYVVWGRWLDAWIVDRRAFHG